MRAESNYMWYQFLNIFFFVFHTAFTIFNIVGWAFPKTRKLHLITMSLTLFSWLILGFWYGWGYCFCTDWHFAVRERLGFIDHSTSYIHFLILEITGLNLDPVLVDYTTLLVFMLSLFMSVCVNRKIMFRSKKFF